MANTTSLYSTTSSGNATIAPNNNTGLYNTGTSPVPINNSISVTGNISAAGNITGGNLISNGLISAVGNVYASNFVGNIIGNLVVPGGNTQVIFNNNGSANASPALTFNTASNVLATTGTITATGNISGNYFLGNGSQLTGLPATYSNANVVSLMANFGSNTIVTTGNISGGYIFGNGSQLTGITAGTNYSNANVSAFLPVYNGNINAPTVFGQGMQVQGYDYVQMQYSNATALPVTPYDIGTGSWFYLDAGGGVFQSNTTGTLKTITLGNDATINAGGNITAPYYFGNGSQLTGITAASSYGNANVADFLANYGSNTITTTGNISAGNVLLGYLLGAGDVTATGNVTGAQIIGNGSQLTNITGSNVTGVVANATYATSAGSAATATQATYANTANSVAGGNVSGQVANALVAGTVYTAAQPNITSVGTLTSLTSSGNITASYFLGNGSQLTDLPVQPGTYSNANVAGFLPIYTGDYAGGNISVGGNVIGNVLKTSGVTGNIVGPNYVSANYFVGDGQYLTNINAGNIIGSYGNANVNALLSAWGANTLSTTGTVTAGNITGGNILTGGVVSATGTIVTAGNANINGGFIRTTAATGTLFGTSGTTTVNIGGSANTINMGTSTGQTTFGSGTGNISAGNINAGNVSATGGIFSTLNMAAGNISTTGTFSAAGNVTAGANLIVSGLITATGNITGGNILTGGVVSAVGNIVGNYFIGNGSQLTGIVTSSYGNSNVNTLLAAWGSNALSTTGNVTASYLVGNGSLLTSLTGANVSGTVANATYATSAGTATSATTAGTVTTAAQANITSVGTLTSLSVTGKVTSGAVAYANTDGTNGQVLTTYGNGITYFSTVSGGSGSPGGATTQLQYNNAGSFAGNAAMTFDNTTGNVTLGNIVVNTNQIQTVATANIAATTASGQTTPWRVLLGNAYNGNTNSAYSSTSPGTVQSPLNAPRLLVADFVTLPDSGMRFQEHTNYIWANLSANIANTGTRFSVQRNEMTIGGGTAGYGITATSTPTLLLGTSTQINLGAGTNANLSLIGNITTTAGTTGTFSGVAVNNYSTANVIIGYNGQLTTNNANSTAFGNATTQIGYFLNFSGNPANANITGTTTAIGYYMPGATANSQLGGATAVNGNIARQATNYYSFRSDDTLAKAQLGSLSSFNEFTGNITSSGGALTVSKSTGQVQQIYPTENITSITFSNFVTRVQKPDLTYANQSDTVTLIIQQGATPYTVTMPSGTAYRYASGVTTVGSTANTTTMISITGTYNYNTAAVQYLITISPEFS